MKNRKVSWISKALAAGSESSQMKKEREQERGREQTVRVAEVHILPHLQNILRQHHQLFSNFMFRAAHFSCSHLVSHPSSGARRDLRYSSWSQLRDNPFHRVIHQLAVISSEWQIFSSLSGGSKKEWNEQRSKWGGRQERNREVRRAPVEFHRQVSTMTECVQEPVMWINERVDVLAVYMCMTHAQHSCMFDSIHPNHSNEGLKLFIIKHF